MLTWFLLATILVVYFTSTWRRLRTVPGPFLAKFTDLHRLLSVYRRDAHNEQLELHRRHGDFVRLGPNLVSVSGVDYILQIYGIGKGLVKSDFYSCFQNVVNGRRAASLVAMTDESDHARTKRHVAHAYSLSTLVEFERFVDSTNDVLLRELASRFTTGDDGRSGAECDLGKWLQYYAFDVIGELTFSKRLGFVERGEDVDNIIGSIGANFDYFSVLAQMPWLDSCLGKNPLYVKYFRKPVTSPILKFAQKLLAERLRDEEQKEKRGDGDGGVEGGGGGDDKSRDGSNSSSSSKRRDFLTRFLQVRKETPDSVSDTQVLSYLFMNVNAGSDTIASTLRAIFYNLLKNQSTLQKLVDELETAHASSHLTLPTPKWHETQGEHTPYLRAVIKEGLRLNPALSLPLERVVPKEGMTLYTNTKTTTDLNNETTTTGSASPLTQTKPHPHDPPTTNTTFFPGGTILGINPYTIQRDPRIFSPDPDEWRPERWIPTPSSSPSPSSPFQSSTTQTQTQAQTQIRQMENHILSFGFGKRSCMGRNIAMLELSKLIPALVCRFNFELVRPETGWIVKNAWVLSQRGLVVRLSERRERNR